MVNLTSLNLEDCNKLQGENVGGRGCLRCCPKASPKLCTPVMSI